MSGLLRHLVRRVMEPEASLPPARRVRFVRLPAPPFPEPAPDAGLAPERSGRPAEVFRAAADDPPPVSFGERPHEPSARRLANNAPSLETPAPRAARAGAAKPPEQKAKNEDSRRPDRASPDSPFSMRAGAAAPIENGVAVEAPRDSTAAHRPGNLLRPTRAERQAPVIALSEAAEQDPASRAPARPEHSIRSLGEGEALLVTARGPAEAARARPLAPAPFREPASLPPALAAGSRQGPPLDRPKPPAPSASTGPAAPAPSASPVSTARPILPEARPAGRAAAEPAGLLPRRAEGPRPAPIGRPGRAPAPPDVHITIGRVEIRAVAAAPPERKPAPSTPAPVERLADYLARRDGARR